VTTIVLHELPSFFVLLELGELNDLMHSLFQLWVVYHFRLLIRDLFLKVDLEITQPKESL